MFFPKEEEKHFFCHACRNELDFDRIKMQRTDTCPHCAADLHCCKNCKYWEPGAHNQCTEQIAEYVPERERANHCMHFIFLDGAQEKQDLAQAKSKLDSLFKKR